MRLSDLFAILTRCFRVKATQPNVAVVVPSPSISPSMTSTAVQPPISTEIPSEVCAVAPEVAPDWLSLCRPLTQHFEQCRLRAYWDQYGKVWTVGWGATGPDIRESTVWTQAQADDQLDAALRIRAAAVDRLVAVSITAAQKAALVDFAYNVGVGALERSTLLEHLNAGAFDNAAEQFLVWDKAGGVVLSGLRNRREAERSLFITGSWSKAS